MSIDLGDNPITGTEPTLEEKAQIREALGLGNTITTDGSATLTNKTLLNANFTGSVYGQFELSQQQLLTNKSALNAHGLFAQQNNIQRFNFYRPFLLKGGLNVDVLATQANNTRVDIEDVVGVTTATNSSIDHTTFLTYRFGRCFMNSSSGSSMQLSNPYSFAMRCTHALFNGVNNNNPGIYHIGLTGSHQGGMPVGKGWGLCTSIEGYRLWSTTGTEYVFTGTKDNNTLTLSSGTHNFNVNDVVRFIGTITSDSVPTGQTFNLVTTTAYFVVEKTTNTLKLSNTKGGTPIALNGNMTSGKIPALPTYSAAFSGLPTMTDFNANVNFLFTTSGDGTGSVFYGPYNGPVQTTPKATITIPNTGAIEANMYMCFTSRNSYIPGQAVDANGIPGSGTGFSNRQTGQLLTGISFAPF